MVLAGGWGGAPLKSLLWMLILRMLRPTSRQLFGSSSDPFYEINIRKSNLSVHLRASISWGIVSDALCKFVLVISDVFDDIWSGVPFELLMCTGSKVSNGISSDASSGCLVCSVSDVLHRLQSVWSSSNQPGFSANVAATWRAATWLNLFENNEHNSVHAKLRWLHRNLLKFFLWYLTGF